VQYVSLIVVIYVECDGFKLNVLYVDNEMKWIYPETRSVNVWNIFSYFGGI